MGDFLKKYTGNVRKLLAIWIVFAIMICHVIGFQYTWVIFLSNMFLFTLEGQDWKQKFITVECGGLVGLLFAILTVIIIVVFQGVLGEFLTYFIGVGCVVAAIILLGSVAPIAFNNVTFAYYTVALIDAELFMKNLPLFFGAMIVGSLIVNGVSIALFKPAKKITIEQMEKTAKKA